MAASLGRHLSSMIQSVEESTAALKTVLAMVSQQPIDAKLHLAAAKVSHLYMEVCLVMLQGIS